ncbi:MAG: substrate-binding domain-containing protein [Limimaricola sp.]|uniref:LacI family DNA-binding transcriptional regulator n=1 Tax=Limimaricola sp. TaxID=2211665 RepID=UPI001DC6BD61|nr:LacI family DNA-binding transcriptional regulator [Limimaricola sp.]MBI1417923.1 substrate-binding domain-containing protein [Limimaricola sp.]
MRPTTKDLAREAGVSLATVDRVLNERPGVTAETVRRVNEAIDKLGFVRNASAAILARRRPYRFLFVLPRTGDQFLGEVIARISEANAAFASEMVVAEVVQIDTLDPHLLAKYLTGLDPAEVDGVAIMAPESPPVRDAVLRLPERGIEGLAFITGQPGTPAGDFVGIDNHAAGATAGRLMGRFAGGAEGGILVVADTMHARDSIERRQGFDEVITRDFPRLTALPSLETYGDHARARQIIGNAMQSRQPVVGFYVLGSEARVALAAAAEVAAPRPQIVIVHERTPFTEDGLRKGDIDAVIAQNPGHLVRSAIRTLRAKAGQSMLLASQEKIRIEIVLLENL